MQSGGKRAMIFTVDVGNTNIVLGLFDNDELKFVSRVATEASKTEDQYAIDFNNVLSLYGYKKEQIDGAIISSVVPPLASTLKRALQKLFPCKILTVSAGIKTGLNIRIDDPATLGSDMVCAAVGALSKYPMPCIVFDLGTATTISAMGENGEFLGGSILPGVKVSLKALSGAAAQLPDVGTELAGDMVFGTNTIDSMRSGLILGNASMMDGMIDRYRGVLGENASVVATGGMASVIAPYCKRDIIVDDTLLLDGLYLIYKKNA